MSRVERQKAKNFIDWICDDITFCMSDKCNDTSCFRHRSNIKTQGLHSFADFYNTDDCPLGKRDKPKIRTFNDTMDLLQALKTEAESERKQRHYGVARGLKRAMKLTLANSQEGKFISIGEIHE